MKAWTIPKRRRPMRIGTGLETTRGIGSIWVHTAISFRLWREGFRRIPFPLHPNPIRRKVINIIRFNATPPAKPANTIFVIFFFIGYFLTNLWIAFLTALANLSNLSLSVWRIDLSDCFDDIPYRDVVVFRNAGNHGNGKCQPSFHQPILLSDSWFSIS